MKPETVQLRLPPWISETVDFDRAYVDHDSRIALAIELAQRNVQMQTGGPFGAAVFDGAGRLIAVGVNCVVAEHCSLAHAEAMALALAQQRLQRARLNEGGGQWTLATSSQPCCQCYGALVWGGIDELLIGARAEDVESLTGFDEGPLPTDWIGELQSRRIAVTRDLHRDKACMVLADYARRGGIRY